MHSRFHGSAFRNKMPKDPVVTDVEDPLKESGLLGRNPSAVNIIRSNTSQATLNSPQTDTIKITRPKTAFRQLQKPKQTTIDIEKLLKEHNITPRRTTETTTSIFQDTKPEEGPHVFYGKVLQPNEPPAETNFLQLSEMIDRLMDHGDIDAETIYYKIFGDVVRQYYIECTLQGDVLEKCRTFFSSAQKEIPKIEREYKQKVTEVEDKIEKVNKLADQYGPEVIKNKDHSERLTIAIADKRNDLQVLIDHYDSIVKQVGLASKEAASIKEEMNQLDNRIAEKNKQLVELNNELRQLDTLSTNYTADTLRFAENLKMLRQQQEESRKGIQDANNEMQDFKNDIMALDREILTATETIEKSRVVPDKSPIEIQCDIISRRLFAPKKIKRISHAGDRPSVAGSTSNIEFEDDVFKPILNAYNNATKQNYGQKKINVQTYEDFATLKHIILNNDKEFRMDDEDIKQGEAGEVEIKKDNTDFLRLFASKIVSDAIYRACRTKPVTTATTQSLLPQPKVETEIQQKTEPQAKTTFLGLLKTNYSNRAPKRLEWLLTEIRQILSEKTAENADLIADKKPLTPFPKFVFDYAKRLMKLDYMTDQYCWDLYISCHEHADRTPEVELFTCFLDQVFNDEQLAFALRARTDCIKVGCSIPIKTRDQLETLSEYYLSQDQIEKALKRWWAARYQNRFYIDILELSIARPAIHLESTKRYVAMQDILQKCIIEYQNDVIARLNEQLLLYRIIPRLSAQGFNDLMYQLIPALTQSQVEDFYRSTVTKAKQREDVDIDGFIEIFKEGCLLYHQNFKESSRKTQMEADDVHATVETLWFRSQANIKKIIEFFTNQLALQPDNLTLRTYLDDANRYMSMLNHSLTTSDGVAGVQHYFSLIFTLDVMYSTISYIDAELFKPSLISAECAIRESWLDAFLS
ncbi:hypothetical protein TVAG_332860 [Trichomonas vaginalis G3]|uniref:Uncharacterized protein n=1 Tax=Trichomonas vaginalis (strain ATCC PRA-98 / G3) TaxID=412133 RepID=A2EH82_TRIV3|nr:hypothetical protein TVAGG3_0933530 [Trichomonas vaginalis G3]EAY07961.1 hypothetical protein TVAG_332860 [Trichomonas vaginalis G3]KAI5486008.1 hypothetical protein TVAGG3_0933530 [Trichomonas vaginalis G3]|eukprot:XP_001320184.1 hypothetical protein [Trichomonas vaginalis G3]